MLDETPKQADIAVSGLVGWALANERLTVGTWHELRIPSMVKDAKTVTVNDDCFMIYKYDSTIGEYSYFGKFIS